MSTLAARHTPFRMYADPEVELRRSEAVAALMRLDCRAQEAFARVARLAQTQLRVGHAEVALIDHDNRWMIADASGGVVPEPASRVTSLCGFTIVDEATLVFEDIQDHPEVAASIAPSVLQNLRFYAGASLRMVSGDVVGTLAIWDEAPRTFTIADRILLEDLAATVVDLLEMRKMSRDVAEARAELERRNRMLATQRALSPDGIVVTAPDGRFVSWNARFQALWEIPTEALLHTDPSYTRQVMVRQLADPDRLDALDTAIAQAPTRAEHGEVLLLSDGRVVVRHSQAMISDSGIVEGRVWYYRDITAFETAQRQLVKAERLASLGRLVNGVAHELNTPLGIAIGSVSQIDDELAPLTTAFQQGRLAAEDLSDFLDTAGQAVKLARGSLDRAANLVQSFKRIAVDRGSDGAELVSVEQILHECTGRLRQNYPGIACVCLCTADLSLLTYRGALIDALMTVLENIGVHAYGDNATGNAEILVSRGDDGLTRIAVSDHGQGIAPEQLPHIFDPFFTTTRHRGSTGLGLHMAFSLLRSVLGGDISAVATRGVGTTITLTLPPVAPGAGTGPE